MATALALAAGLALVALGGAGIRYAPAIVAAQHRQGMTPLEDDDEVDTGDRIRVTKGAGVALALVGLALLAYAVGVV